MNSKMLQDLLERRMTRREFLAYIGAAILGVIGVNALLKSLQNHVRTDTGYGAGPYGGFKK